MALRAKLKGLVQQAQSENNTSSQNVVLNMDGTELPTDMWNCIIGNFAIDRKASHIAYTALSRITLYNIGLVSKQFHKLVKKMFIAEDKGKLWEIRYYVMNLLADLGCLDLLKYFKECKRFELHFDVANHAARHGHVNILEYCFEQKCPMRHTVCDNAAEGGHLNCLKYAMSHKVVAKAQAAVSACQNDSVECLEFLIEKQVAWNKMAVAEKAISSGAIKCLKFALANGANMPPSTMMYVASSRSIEMLKFVFEHYGRTWPKETESNLVRFSTMEFLEFATNNGIQWTPNVYSCAAERGSLETIQYFLKLGIKVSNEAAYGAVAYGSIDILELLLENGCQQPENALIKAATKGRIDMIDLMRKYNWQWEDNIGVNIAHCKPEHWDILKYCMDNGYNWEVSKCTMNYTNDIACQSCINIYNRIKAAMIKK